MATFVPMAKTYELPPDQSKLVEINHKRIALFNVGGHFYAIDDMCPNRSGPLSLGEIEGTTGVCPWHDASLDLATGVVIRSPAEAGVAVYPVRLEGEDLTIAV